MLFEPPLPQRGFPDRRFRMPCASSSVAAHPRRACASTASMRPRCGSLAQNQPVRLGAGDPSTPQGASTPAKAIRRRSSRFASEPHGVRRGRRGSLTVLPLRTSASLATFRRARSGALAAMPSALSMSSAVFITGNDRVNATPFASGTAMRRSSRMTERPCSTSARSPHHQPKLSGVRRLDETPYRVRLLLDAEPREKVRPFGVPTCRPPSPLP